MPNYTYDDFTRAADAAGLTGSFDASDLTMAQKFPEYGLSLVSLKRDLGNAQTAEQRLLATEAMNQLRKNYGSYGVGEGANRSYAASYGSRINQALDDIGSYRPYNSAYGDQISRALSDIGNYGDFQYSQDNAYKDVLDRIINQKSFSYDPSTDPIFSSYKKAYNREGDRAAANALAAASAATGGRASSFANVAAQQQANYYAGKLADMIPTLRSQALNEYNSQYDQLLRQMNAMASDRNNEYQQYLDRLNQMQQNLQNLQGQDATEYGRYTDQLAQMQQDLDNLRAQDTTDYSRYLDELNAEYQRERDAAADKQNEFDNALKIYQATGQITGPLADYLGGGSTYAAAAATYTGGGGYGGGSYRGSQSGNAPTAADAAAAEEIDSILGRYGFSQITGEPYIDSNGKQFALISNWDDYQRLKELSGATDAQLNQAGISYPYPTVTDENGDTAPATRYTTPSGLAVTWEQDDLIGGNYQTAAQTFETMRLGGATKDAVLKEIKDWYNSGDLKQSDYTALYKKYRQMDSSDFGTQAVATTPSTSGRATGTGTVQPGTRTPGAATATTTTPTTAAPTVDAVTGAAPVVSTPAYDWRGIPWAQSPDNPANQKSTTSTKNTSTSAAPLFPVIDGVTGAAPSVSKPSNTSGGTSSGSLLTQLGNALKNALQLSGQMTQTAPGVGINPAGASASGSKSTSSSSSGKRTSGTSVNADGFSHSSGSIGGSGATKSTSTTVKSASTSSPVSTLTSILNNVKPGSTLSSKSTSSKSSGTTTKKTTTTGGGKYASRGAR